MSTRDEEFNGESDLFSTGLDDAIRYVASVYDAEDFQLWATQWLEGRHRSYPRALHDDLWDRLTGYLEPMEVHCAILVTLGAMQERDDDAAAYALSLEIPNGGEVAQ